MAAVPTADRKKVPPAAASVIMAQSGEELSMARTRFLAILGLAAAGVSFAAQAADSGKITYGAGNCFVIETGKGSTLFERSGGQAPKPGETVTGVLHDFGYQQLFDGGGKELMVGFVQEYDVNKAANVDAFKKSCR